MAGQGAMFLVEGTVWTKACKSAFMESSSAQDGWSVSGDEFQANLRYSDCPVLHPGLCLWGD